MFKLRGYQSDKLGENNITKYVFSDIHKNNEVQQYNKSIDKS